MATYALTLTTGANFDHTGNFTAGPKITWGDDTLHLSTSIGTYTTDVSRDIKPIVDKIVSGATTGLMPAGCIIKDNDRTEYHLGYHDANV